MQINGLEAVCVGGAGGIFGYYGQIPSYVAGELVCLGTVITLAMLDTRDQAITQYCRFGWWVVCFCLGSWLVSRGCEGHTQQVDEPTTDRGWDKTEIEICFSIDSDVDSNVDSRIDSNVDSNVDSNTVEIGIPVFKTDRVPRALSEDSQVRYLTQELKCNLMKQGDSLPHLEINQFKMLCSRPSDEDIVKRVLYVHAQNGQCYQRERYIPCDLLDKELPQMREQLVLVGLQESLTECGLEPPSPPLHWKREIDPICNCVSSE